jgi:hypothetical protein
MSPFCRSYPDTDLSRLGRLGSRRLYFFAGHGDARKAKRVFAHVNALPLLRGVATVERTKILE